MEPSVDGFKKKLIKIKKYVYIFALTVTGKTPFQICPGGFRKKYNFFRFAMAHWTSHPPQEHKTRVRIPPGIN
jgi:hypothetical protein